MAAIQSKDHGEVITNPDRDVEIRHQRVKVRRTDPIYQDGRSQVANGVRGHNGCSGFVLEGLDLRRFGTGAFMTGFDGGRVIGCQFDHMGAEGLQVGGGRKLVVEDCYGHHNTENDWRGGDLGTEADRNHAFYLECQGTQFYDDARAADFGVLMRRCRGMWCDGMGYHGRGSYHTLEDCDFVQNHPGAPGGAGDVQLSGVNHFRGRRLLLELGDSGLTVIEGGSDIRFEDCAIWNPGRDGFPSAFATSCYIPGVEFVGGVICGRIDRTRPIFNPTGVYFPSDTSQARAALAAWKATFRRKAVEPPPPPIDPPPIPDDRAALLDLLTQAEAAHARTGDAITQAAALHREGGDRLARLRELIAK